jgi:hypothetical protein
MPQSGEPIRVAIDATLREAAKNQLWRREEAKVRGDYNPFKVNLLKSLYFVKYLTF